jgi:hypothetical protein
MVNQKDPTREKPSIYSFSVVHEDKQLVNDYLKESKQLDGMTTSEAIIHAIHTTVRLRQAEEGKKTKPLVLPSLMGCSVSNGNDKPETPKSPQQIAEEKLLARGSKKAQEEAHELYHKPQLVRLHQLRLDRDVVKTLQMEMLQANQARCIVCRKEYDMKVDYYNDPYVVNKNPLLVRRTEEEERVLAEARKRFKEESNVLG